MQYSNGTGLSIGDPVLFWGKMIKELKRGVYRLYSKSKDRKTGERRNLGTFHTLAAAKRHEREVEYFKKIKH